MLSAAILFEKFSKPSFSEKQKAINDAFCFYDNILLISEETAKTSSIFTIMLSAVESSFEFGEMSLNPFVAIPITSFCKLITGPPLLPVTIRELIVTRSCLTPAVIVTTLACIWPIIYMMLCMKLAILIIGQQRAAVMFAGLLWFLWHCSQLHTQLKKPRQIILQWLYLCYFYTLHSITGIGWLNMAFHGVFF